MKSKLTNFVMSLLVAFNVVAADNSIYIDQSGNNATVNITQDGAGNVVQGIQGTGTSNTTPATILLFSGNYVLSPSG